MILNGFPRNQCNFQHLYDHVLQMSLCRTRFDTFFNYVDMYLLFFYTLPQIRHLTVLNTHINLISLLVFPVYKLPFSLSMTLLTPLIFFLSILMHCGITFLQNCTLLT